MRKTTLFRQLVNAPELLMLPVAHDGLAMLAVAQAGFRAACLAGYGTAGSVLGLPDISLISSTEMLTHYANLIARVDLPIMVDIDTGFGDVNNVIRTVRQVEQMGAAALFIEDQTYPKRCGHMAGKSVVDVDEYLPKLKAAVWARQDPDFVIMARTDARAVYGLDEAIRRARLYAEAGGGHGLRGGGHFRGGDAPGQCRGPGAEHGQHDRGRQDPVSHCQGVGRGRLRGGGLSVRLGFRGGQDPAALGRLAQGARHLGRIRLV